MGNISIARNHIAIIQGLLFRKFLAYSNTYYFKTHTRISPWLIGGLLGYVLAKINLDKNMEYQKIPKVNITA